MFVKACKLSPLDNAGVAQLAEQLIRNQQVGSSNLLPGSIEELTSVYLYLEDAKKLAALHAGIRLLPDMFLQTHKLASIMKQLAKLGSDEFPHLASRMLAGTERLHSYRLFLLRLFVGFLDHSPCNELAGFDPLDIEYFIANNLDF